MHAETKQYQDVRRSVRGLLANLPTRGPSVFHRTAWDRLADHGFTTIGIPEELSGAGGDDAAAIAVIEEVARAGVSLPLLEHLWLAGWALAHQGLPLPAGVCGFATAELSIGRAGEDWVVTGSAARVPWARVADQLVLVAPEVGTVVVPVTAVAIQPASDVLGVPQDRVGLDSVRLPAGAVRASSPSSEEIAARVLAGRLSQIRAAARAALKITLRYVTTREQFGRPLARFQAVQQRLACAAAEVALLDMGAELARHGSPLDAAMARVDAARSVAVVSSQAHQLHGAMGVTAEYGLGRLTLAMRAWLSSTGPDDAWHRRVGAALSEDLWRSVIGESLD
ncbi:MAG TPA: acyl-CoA dehydrogenase family protein [Nocardioidaceae bacterium]|nr:acyl-CoA dehydrogenase family protein [Nocardioidaceae bacterium]